MLDVYILAFQFGILSSAALADALATSRLVVLTLQNCSIDDAVLDTLVAGFQSSSTLRHLDFSKNSIGDAGMAVLTQGILTTPVLHSLEFLNVGWNSFGQLGTVAVSRLVAASSALLGLSLQWNAVRDDAMIVLAASLHSNQSLYALNVAHTQLSSRAIAVLLSYVAEHPTLATVIVNGNTVGSNGLRAALRCMERSPTVINHLPDLSVEGGPVKPFALSREVVMEGCNFETDPEVYPFDLSQAPGHFRLNLADPCDRVIATEVIRLWQFYCSVVVEDLSYRPLPSIDRATWDTIKKYPTHRLEAWVERRMKGSFQDIHLKRVVKSVIQKRQSDLRSAGSFNGSTTASTDGELARVAGQRRHLHSVVAEFAKAVESDDECDTNTPEQGAEEGSSALAKEMMQEGAELGDTMTDSTVTTYRIETANGEVR